MQIEIHGSLVTIQYYTKCTDPLYPKFTSKKISALNFCWNLYKVIAYVLIPTTEKVNTIYQSFLLIMGLLLQQKYTDMAYPGKFDHKFAITHLQQLQNYVPFFRGRTSDDFRASQYGIQTIKWVSIIFERLWLFSIEGWTIWICTVLKPLKRD